MTGLLGIFHMYKVIGKKQSQDKNVKRQHHTIYSIYFQWMVEQSVFLLVNLKQIITEDKKKKRKKKWGLPDEASIIPF